MNVRRTRLSTIGNRAFHVAAALNSSLLTNGSRVAKRNTVHKTNQMIKVNEIKNNKTNNNRVLSPF